MVDMQRQKRWTYVSEAGAEIPQFALLLAILLPVFVAASVFLYSATRLRTESTIGASSMPVPCAPMYDAGGNLIRPPAPYGFCVPFRPDICTSFAPGTPEYDKLCFCCYP